VKTLYQADLDRLLKKEIQQTDPQLLYAPVPADEDARAARQIYSPQDGEKVGKKISVHDGLDQLPPHGRLWLAVKKRGSHIAKGARSSRNRFLMDSHGL
jgi:hypothetical protein